MQLHARSRGTPDSSRVVAHALAARRRAGAPGAATAQLVARGAGWSIKDVVCTHDPSDMPFEERHNAVGIAMVLAGSFHYRRDNARELLAPGALLLGNYGECFECGHEHAAGDRCVAFHFTPDYFERVAADAGARSATFDVGRVPPLRELTRVYGLVEANLRQQAFAWEELALEVAALTLSLAQHTSARPRQNISARMIASITDTIRMIEGAPGAEYSLAQLAGAAGTSVYYYLRAFQRLTGVTPHQFVLRARLRHAARRIAHEDRNISEIAFASGFGDLSNFNHTFRAELGVSPRGWRSDIRQSTQK